MSTHDSILSMSDDDFLNATPPEITQEASQETAPEAAPAEPIIESDQGAASETPVVGVTPEKPVETPQSEAEPEPKSDEVNPLSIADDKLSKPPEAAAKTKESVEPLGTEAPQGEAAAEGEKPKEGEQTPEEKAAAEAAAGEAIETPIDYKSQYEKILAPFNANGRQVQVKNLDEAMRLMQMGANYTRKMQDIAPHRSVLRMLETNGLLDSEKLSFLIDLDKKDPAAIKQLIKDSGIDPLDIDVTAETGYTPGAHQVSESEEAFRVVLDEVTSTQDGREFLQSVHTTWDTTSKQALADQPEILTALAQQRANGVFAVITTELEHQKTLGTIPATMPFLQAYKAVGDQIAARNGFDHLTESAEKPAALEKPEPVAPAPKVPVATTVAQPKPEATNDAAASAAAPSKSTPTAAKTIVNPLAMSDDEFMALSAHHV